MPPITLTVVVDEKRRVLIDLPDEVPPGVVKITIEPVADSREARPSTSESVREKLIAAGLVIPGIQYAPPDAKPLSPEERERLWKKLAAGKTALELINEEREERL